MAGILRGEVDELARLGATSSSSMPLTTHCWPTPSAASSTSSAAGRRSAGWRWAPSSTTTCSGGFEPLRGVPDDKVAVLGLVTTKNGRVETVDDLERRLREAAAFLPLDRLALSSQCGFATSIVGNDLTVDEEAAKLRVIAETAARVWG